MNKNIIVLSFITIAVILLFVFQEKVENHLAKNKIITTALVNEIELTKRPALPRIHYQILNPQFKDTDFEDISVDFEFKKLRLLKGKYVNIVIDSTNYDVKRLLLSDEEYSKYAVNRPDSMQWLKDLLGR